MLFVRRMIALLLLVVVLKPTAAVGHPDSVCARARRAHREYGRRVQELQLQVAQLKAGPARNQIEQVLTDASGWVATIPQILSGPVTGRERFQLAILVMALRGSIPTIEMYIHRTVVIAATHARQR